MLPEVLQTKNDQLATIRHVPSVAIILPFEPKMASKMELEYRLQLLLGKAHRQLLERYPAEAALPVLEKAKSLVKGLNYSTYKQSVAIVASPAVEKVYYLDVPVEEKLFIDEPFEIRDLVYSQKEIHKYLILVLSRERSRLFLGNTTQFLRIATNSPEHVAAYQKETSGWVSDFSDPSLRKEVMFDQFLRHIDNTLEHVLKAYHLPLFVMATEQMAGHFNKITRHAHRITGWVHGNFEDASENEIREAIAPRVADWKKVMQVALLKKLDTAIGAKKVAIGINEVGKTAANNNGRLLVVEKNFIHAVYKKGRGKKTGEERPFYINDVVDDIIEQVILNGGDVAFVDEGVLMPYHQIALIKYY